MNIPDNHQALMPYLILQNAEDFLRFTANVFGARETEKRLREDGISIMHAEIMINGSTIMVAEPTAQWKASPIHLFIYTEDADSSYAKALAAGASSLMEPNDRDYGRTCGITDPFGNVWWITGAP
ncbi:MAG: VOC family protein [Ferruginibacter sp.]